MNRLTINQVQAIVEDIVQEMSLRDLVSVASMDETDVKIIQHVTQVFLREKLGLDDTKEIGQIVEAMWQKLKESHRLRAVK